MSLRRATEDPSLRVVVDAAHPLVYTERPAGQDLPPHVRAASAVVAVHGGHVVVQDDVHALGLIDALSVRALPLPAPDGVRQFGDARGNKREKADLEAACLWPTATGEVLVGFGSGSLPTRERLVVAVHGADGLQTPRFLVAPGLYAAAREALAPYATDLGGIELNIEGAWRTPEGHLRLLQRGNGRGGVDATVDVDGGWLDAVLRGQAAEPAVRAVRRWHLGTLGGARLTFTDGLPLPDGRWLFAAAAERSPDAIEDGEIVGSAVGLADDHGARWGRVVQRDGHVAPLKLEGIARRGPHLVGVADPDDPATPASLLALRLDGAWGLGAG